MKTEPLIVYLDWQLSNRKDLEQLQKQFESEMKTETDFHTFCFGLFQETKHYKENEHAALLALEKAGNRLQLETIHFRDTKVGVLHLNAALDAFSQASINLTTIRS